MEQLIAFIKKYNFILVFTILMVTSIVLIVRTTYYQQSMVLRWNTALAGIWYGNVARVDEYFALKEENDRLAKENAYLRAHQAESYVSYTATSFEINDTTYNQRYTFTEAQVIKNSWAQKNNYIMINNGQRQGIARDMAVMSPQGIVGVVVICSQNFATIMPVLHMSSSNSVKVKRIGTSGTLKWTGRDYRYASVTDIPTTHKLVPNDTIITSGIANDFPEGIPVGYVSDITDDHGNGFYDITIRLATDFNKLSHVYVIQNRFREEQEELTNETINEIQ